MKPTPGLLNLALFVILGIAFWFEALLFIRFGGEMLFVSDNPWLLFLFVSSIPVAWVLVRVIAVVGKVSGEDLLSAVVLAALTAMLLDGIALTWLQGWYGLGQTNLLLAAAWLLWGVGVSLTVGYWESHRYIAKT
ncbi:hypothetical protein SAMD00079811_83190 (plasmid) [Scytonema sp. HK-05]|uniref:DUF5367 family protein n=1 Tax=Scytonema sp. HK-05 TaxID=1137095 RepID=UPI00093572FE|nr:DUF5367 family protein [Scytonema sp. HK-05]OKH44715.1 hypothetical protein NIES2130_37800 [Scytonema sp. HK-05]BAY50688.1 hypothetical protein SAMD00079811_83190 [Scytonema sp. HK-05]